MAELRPDIAEAVVAACRTGVDEIAEALSRTFDSSLKVAVGEAAPWDAESVPDGFDGPGLVVLLAVGETAALCLLPQSSGLIPTWYENPDATGVSKLTTLGQELGMLVVPEEFMPDDFRAAHVSNLSEAISRAELAEGAQRVPLELTDEAGQTGTLELVWPATRPAAVFSDEAADSSEPAAEEPPAAPQQESSKPPEPAKTVAAAEPSARSVGYENLPAYARSLLHTKIPVSVTLAGKKQPLARIVELGPGSIIQFDKACEEMLSLEVGGQTIAEGEAVKVGEKFGLRVTSLMLPDERFHAVRAS